MVIPSLATPAQTGTAAIAHHVPGFDTRMAARVFSAALVFATPRTLDASNPQELTLWGLHGITALDPAFTADLHGTRLQLSGPDGKLLDRAAPPQPDAAAWGQQAAELEAAAFDHSELLRSSGAQALIQSFFDEMFNHIDPYSRYVPPAPAETERDKLSLDASSGLGLVRQGHNVVVNDVVPSGPGEWAGVRIGDSLIAIGGRKFHGGPDRAQALLSGPDGTEVALKVRGLDGALRNLVVTLAYVPPETVFSRSENAALVIRITSFTSNTAERLSQALEAGLAEMPAPTAIIVDLRGNRGGLLRQAVTSVALLADHGVIASTAGRNPEATHDWRIEDGGDLTHGARLLVLVDGRTASAAEIMAAALADLGRAVVIGSTTLGKGLVQTITTLPDGGELYVTWSRVLAPKSWPIQTLGVMPQVCTSRGEAEENRELDELTAGRAPLAGPLAKTRATRPPLPTAEAVELRLACPAAEGTDRDVVAAAYLATHPRAYEAALIR